MASQIGSNRFLGFTFCCFSHKKTIEQNRTRGRETRNRLTGTRGEGAGDKGGKKGKGLVKEYV